MKLLRLSLSTFLAVATVLTPTALVLARPLSVATTTPSVRASAIAALDTAKITALKAKADTEINRRIKGLEDLQTRIGSLKKLNTSEKTTLQNEVQSEITTMNNLKTKIDGDTDLMTLRADVKSIVDDYRVFALYMPQVETIAAADAILDTTDSFSTLVTKLQTRITTLQTSGGSVTALNQTLTDMQTQIANAKTMATTAETSVESLTPAGYPANKSTLQAARQDLKTARQDLAKARTDAGTIIAALKSANATPIATTTP